MALDRLADVELQLVMHGLEAKEIIQLARCSLRLLAVADSPFAWRHAELHAGASDKTLLPASAAFSSLPPTSCRFLRHLRVSLHWQPPSARPSEHAVTGLLSLCARLPRLTALDFSACKAINSADWLRILAHPSLRTLRRLTLHHKSSTGFVNDAMLKLIARLPQLQSLHCMSLKHVIKRWSLLAASPALTSLRFRDVSEGGVALSAAPQCPTVTHLHIVEPQLYGSAFLSVLGGPSLQQLRSLTLEYFFAHDAEGYMADAFASLRLLRSLSLIRVCDVEEMLPHAICAPALRRLTLQPHSSPTWNEFPSAPSPPALCALLTAKPKLHCTIRLRVDDGMGARATPSNDDLKQLADFQTCFSTSEQLRAFAGRFTLLCEFP